MNLKIDQKSKGRVQYIDWLRIGAVLLLFIFHTNEVFSHKYFYYVKNDSPSLLAAFLNSFIYYWHMPLFMFLSGIGTYYALNFRSGKLFAIERFKRLFIPLIFAIAVLIPPLSYIRCMGKPELSWPQGLTHLAPGSTFNLSFLEFYPEFFTKGIFPFGYLEWSHLWFVAYLFTFSIIALPLFLYLKSEKGKKVINRSTKIVQSKYGIYLFILPIAFFEVTLRWKYPGLQNLISDWANFMTYLTVYILGFLIVSHASFLQAIDKIWKPSIVTGSIIGSILTAWYIYGVQVSVENLLAYITFWTCRAIVIWLIAIGLLGIARQFLNYKNRFLEYAREAALPYYILHQVAIVIIGYFIVQLKLNIIIKYLLVLFGSFISTALIYHYIVIPFNIMRFFFGLKKK